jgi:predicted dehydrogenase
MQSRRNFIGRVASGLAGTLATSSVLGANDRIRIGIIGAGDRGAAILREAVACPNVECVGAADVYTRRLEEAKKIAPEAKTYLDYRHLLEDKSVDAILVGTPQHLHCEHFSAALDAGKHVYQEKTMAFTVDHAKRMRAAYQRAGKRVVQIGHQGCSSGQVTDARSFMESGNVGKVTAIHAHMFRNTPHGKPQWSRPVQPDMTPENVIWKSFLGEAPAHEFDANRYINWRFYWDYSGGNVYENMCHQVSFWYKVLGLKVPKTVTMTGGNSQLGVTEDVLGTDGTILKSQQIKYVPQKVNRPDGTEMAGLTKTAPRAHMQNFFDCIRGGGEPNCPFDVGYRVSIACRMAVESYRQQRAVRWDAAKEEIV